MGDSGEVPQQRPSEWYWFFPPASRRPWPMTQPRPRIPRHKRRWAPEQPRPHPSRRGPHCPRCCPTFRSPSPPGPRWRRTCGPPLRRLRLRRRRLRHHPPGPPPPQPPHPPPPRGPVRRGPHLPRPLLLWRSLRLRAPSVPAPGPALQQVRQGRPSAALPQSPKTPPRLLPVRKEPGGRLRQAPSRRARPCRQAPSPRWQTVPRRLPEYRQVPAAPFLPLRPCRAFPMPWCGWALDWWAWEPQPVSCSCACAGCKGQVTRPMAPESVTLLTSTSCRTLRFPLGGGEGANW